MSIFDRLLPWRQGRMVVNSTGLTRGAFRYLNNTLASNETIFSAVSMLSGAMGSLPIALRRDAERVEAGSHPVARLLEFGPNPNMTTFQFVRCLEVLRDCTGAGYALIEPDLHSRIRAVWPLKTECIEPLIDRETRVLYYHIRDPDSGEDIYLHNSLVLAVNHISADGEHPINPIDVLQNSLDYDREVKEFSVNQMKRGLRANAVFKFTQSLSKEQIEEFDSMMRGFVKSGVIYLDAGKQFQELKESSIIDPKVFDVENITIARVARVYTIPLEKFLPEKTSYSSAEQSDLNYLRDTILPMTRMYEQEFTKKLLTEQERLDGMRVKFSLNGLPGRIWRPGASSTPRASAAGGSARMRSGPWRTCRPFRAGGGKPSMSAKT